MHRIIDDTLRNKIILCTGSAFQQKEKLIDTYNNDIRFIPFKKVFFSTCDQNNLDISLGKKKPVCEYFLNQGKQLNCSNCVLTTIRNAVNDREVLDDDIILFKHESHFVKDPLLIKRALEMILLDDYEMVIQSFQEWLYTGNFFLRVSSARPIFSHLSAISKYPPNAPFNEGYLTNYIFNQVERIHRVNCSPHEAANSRLGFYHLPFEPVGQHHVWGMEDYHELFPSKRAIPKLIR